MSVFGYNDSEEISVKYLGLTNRCIDIPAKQAYYGSIITQESLIEGQQQQLEVVKNLAIIYFPTQFLHIDICRSASALT